MRFFLGVAVSFFALAEVPQKIFIDSELKHPSMVCNQSKEIPLNQDVVLCEQMGSNGEKLRLRARAELHGHDQVVLKGKFESINKNGLVKTISAPQIATLLDEEAEVSQSAKPNTPAELKWTVWVSKSAGSDDNQAF